MEGGAKGQVGGMEMGEVERKRLATESRVWRCQACGGTTNEEILNAEEQRCKEKDGIQGTSKVSAKEQIPDELQFGFRDEMGRETSAKGKEKEPLTGGQSGNQDESVTSDRRESVHYAGPEDLRSSPPPPASAFSPPPAPTAIPGQRVRQPLPTRTTSIPSDSTNGVPAWVDKAIVGVVAGLAVMVVKKIAT